MRRCDGYPANPCASDLVLSRILLQSFHSPITRDAISEVLGRWCASRTLDEIRQAFAGTGVLWGHFQDFSQLVKHDPRCSEANPLFVAVDQPGIGRYLMPGLPLDFSGAPRAAASPAPLLGQHTDLVLGEVLGLSSAEIGRLNDQHVIAEHMERGATIFYLLATEQGYPLYDRTGFTTVDRPAIWLSGKSNQFS